MPVFLLGRQPVFPDPEMAEPDGLLATGGDLAPARLLEAYRNGIFPWPWGEGQPLVWYSPPVRCVFEPGTFRANRSLHRVLRSGRFEFRFDTRFAEVVRGCAETKRPGQRGTWITQSIARAYKRLHVLGHAHSAEAFDGPRLAGGVYGVAIGGAFFAESMFHTAPNASKTCLCFLSELLASWGFALIDAQIPTPFLKTLGALEIPRREYLARVARATALPGRPGPWTA